MDWGEPSTETTVIVRSAAGEPTLWLAEDGELHDALGPVRVYEGQGGRASSPSTWCRPSDVFTMRSVMRRELVVHSLRSQIASAVCAAQSLPVPRSSLARMLKTLLLHALELLDDDCLLDWSTVQRVAVHALAAWHASRIYAGPSLTAAAPV